MFYIIRHTPYIRLSSYRGRLGCPPKLSLLLSHLEWVDKVGEGESIPEGLSADEHVQHGELVDAGDDQEQVDEGQVDEELVEAATREL